MEKLKENWPILVFILVILLVFFIGRNKSKEEIGRVSCKNEEITIDMVNKLAGNGVYDEEMIKQINKETPYCRNLCLEQLEYSKQYDDWSAEEDLRQTCNNLGIYLPTK